MKKIKKYWEDEVPSSVKALLIMVGGIVGITLLIFLGIKFPMVMMVFLGVVTIVMGIMLVYITYEVIKGAIEWRDIKRKYKR